MVRRLLLSVALGAMLCGATTSAARPTGVLQPMLRSHVSTAGYTPAQIATAYGYQPLLDEHINGAGQTVALLEVSQYDQTDVATFDSRYGLAAPQVSEMYVGTGEHLPDRHAETDFDVEWLHALAPGATIQIYYLDPSEPIWQQFDTALKAARTHGARTISISIGACHRSRGYAALKATLHRLLLAGISVFAASGDYGDKPGPAEMCGNALGVTYPAADPSVVAVGGTSLTLNVDNTIRTETAWSMSGGGLVKSLTRFPWQHAPTMPTDTRRWAPDVSFVGDEHTGVAYVHNGRWHVAGGTSLGAPAWAAAWALVRQDVASIGKIPRSAARLLYRIGNSSLYSSDFHDVTAGSNGAYSAHRGWDPVTGWGTPDVENIAATVKGWLEAGSPSS